MSVMGPSSSSVVDQQLYYAAQAGNLEGMRSALSNGADINWMNSGGSNRTPLHAAAISNKADAVQWLLENGADLESRDGDGDTPLIWAAANGHTQAVTMLLEKGADVAASTNTYKRPVGIDIFFGMEDILRIKMYTCTLNVPPLSTYSILWCIEDRPTIKWGRAALDYAERNDHSDTATILRVHS
uniref:Uncharacterized protein n=1 Tax=Amphimedon queenslandica TaxID=400682 RepID=A0A1X7TRF1_AMPQE